MELEDFSRTHIIQNICRGAFSYFAKSELLGEKFGRIKTSGFPGFGIPDWDWELGLNCGKGKKLPEKLLEKK